MFIRHLLLFTDTKLQKQFRSGSGDLGSSQSDVVFDESFGFDKQPLVETVSHVQVPASQRGRRRASMQDALDPTLINARIYEQMVSCTQSNFHSFKTIITFPLQFL